MIVFKLITAWLIIGCISHALMLLKIWKIVVLDYKGTFDYKFSIKCTVCSIITWPRFMADVNKALEKFKSINKNKRSS